MSQHQESAPPARTGQQPPGLEFPTESHLGREARTSITRRLNLTLADATVLATHAKFAHWNVRGTAFFSLHRLFDEIAEALAGHVDLVAERIAALGGQALGTAGMAVSSCRLPRMPADLATGPQYVEALVERLAIHDASLAEDVHAANEVGDLDTADLLNEVSREVSTYRWFLEAHVRARPLEADGGHGGGDPSPGRLQQEAPGTGRGQGPPPREPRVRHGPMGAGSPRSGPEAPVGGASRPTAGAGSRPPAGGVATAGVRTEPPAGETDPTGRRA